MTEPGPESADERRSRRWRDTWQLHIPLVVVLAGCITLTVVEARRAGDGVWRAWAYMFEWPLIGLFTIWIWHRYRTQGSVTRGLADRWRAHVAQYGAAEDEPEDEPDGDGAAVDGSGERPAENDVELTAWERYLGDLRRREPPGGPPTS